MRLETLLSGLEAESLGADREVEISGICYDTRKIQAGELFVALPGYKTDGALYIREALEKGAAAVVCQSPPEEPGPWIRATDPRRTLAQLSCRWFGYPARSLPVIGVTGTNGKTTVTYLLKSMLEETLGAKVGLIGTNQILIGETALPAGRTTPESWEVQSLLRRMEDQGCAWAVMEVSSHALMMHRVEGIEFKAGIFTNLTQDHLDFHKTMEAYRAAKQRLFAQSERAVLNLDDETGRYYASQAPCPVTTYSESRKEADLTAANLRLFPDRVEFEAVARGQISRVRLPIPGGFTVYNALACLGCGLALGLPLERTAPALSKAKGVKGRIEVVPTPGPYTVVIDYAHTPDALESILTSLRDFTKGRLLCLFGCGGDRDRSKRKLMGAIACELADYVIFTSDNPRTERPEDILADILSGVGETETPYAVEADRRKAIRLALEEGRPGDVILLAGKGHETWQEVEGEKLPLDEREEVRAYFRSGEAGM